VAAVERLAAATAEPLLAQHGFDLAGRRPDGLLLRRHDAHTRTIWLVETLLSPASPTLRHAATVGHLGERPRMTVLLGVWHPQVERHFGRDPQPPDHAYACHAHTRLGDLLDVGSDLAWSVGTDEVHHPSAGLVCGEPRKVAAGVVRHLHATGVPWLAAMADPGHALDVDAFATPVVAAEVAALRCEPGVDAAVVRAQAWLAELESNRVDTAGWRSRLDAAAQVGRACRTSRDIA
jgi:hypothetical protein